MSAPSPIPEVRPTKGEIGASHGRCFTFRCDSADGALAAVEARAPKISRSFLARALGALLALAPLPLACVDLGRPGISVDGAAEAGAGSGGRAGRDGDASAPVDLGGASDERSSDPGDTQPPLDTPGTGGASEPGGQGGQDATGGAGTGGAGVGTGGAGGSPPTDTGPPPPPDAPVVIDNGPAPLPKGASCSSGSTCASGNCVDGVCCESACSETCRACNRPGQLGTCALEPAQTVCAPASCAAGTARLDSVCNGAGQCLPGATTACGAYACYMTFCGSACITNSDCAAPYTCSGTACTSPGLLLRWAFDEEVADTAVDSSGNGRHGQMVGNTYRPQPSSNAPVLRFPNPRSRAFIAAYNEGVVWSSIPSTLRTTDAFTLAAWFRATTAKSGGSDVIALGNDVGLRLFPDRFQIYRRRNTTPGIMNVIANKDTTAHLNGSWHHLAGTFDGSVTRLYFDGVEIDETGNNEPTLYTSPDEVGAGHQPGSDAHEFDGHIDDVRIYGRALSPLEIAHLATGNR